MVPRLVERKNKKCKEVVISLEIRASTPRLVHLAESVRSATALASNCSLSAEQWMLGRTVCTRDGRED